MPLRSDKHLQRRSEIEAPPDLLDYVDATMDDSTPQDYQISDDGTCSTCHETTLDKEGECLRNETKSNNKEHKEWFRLLINLIY